MRKLSIYAILSLAMLSSGLHAQTSGNSLTGPQETTPPSTMTPAEPAPMKYPPLTEVQLKEFQDKMNALVQVDEKQVEEMLIKIQDLSKMPTYFDKSVLENAIINLTVKKTIIEKFGNSPSLKSPKVRQALISVLSKPHLTEADLANLQSITNSERQYTYP